jgi:hypothetical protein
LTELSYTNSVTVNHVDFGDRFLGGAVLLGLCYSIHVNLGIPVLANAHGGRSAVSGAVCLVRLIRTNSMKMKYDADHTHPYNGDDPVSLTEDGPKMKAWEKMRAPEDVHNIIIRSLPCATSRN